MNRAGQQDVVILAAKRTPFGTFGGALKDLSATDLGVHAAKAAIAQAGVPPEDFGHVVIGNVALLLGVAIGAVRVVEIKPEGKAAMDARAWARGVRDLPAATWGSAE